MSRHTENIRVTFAGEHNRQVRILSAHQGTDPTSLVTGLVEREYKALGIQDTDWKAPEAQPKKARKG